MMTFIFLLLLLLPHLSVGVTPVFILSYIRLTAWQESITVSYKRASIVAVGRFGVISDRSGRRT